MDVRQLYLDLLKRCVLGMIYQDAPSMAMPIGGYVSRRYIPKVREWGRDLPSEAHSMIGLRRMNNLQHCIEQVLAGDVPGDLIETGVWRGGATIFMRGVLKAYAVTHRRVWVADSFEGLPAPDIERFPQDANWSKSTGCIAVSLETVQQNFARYGLLDEQVRFLKGWFRDTLPTAPIDRLAVMRLDGDLYRSTWDALVHLYPRLSPGGYAIVDDFNLASCREAVEHYRQQHNIQEPICDIDGFGVFWRRAA